MIFLISRMHLFKFYYIDFSMVEGICVEDSKPESTISDQHTDNSKSDQTAIFDGGFGLNQHQDEISITMKKVEEVTKEERPCQNCNISEDCVKVLKNGHI